MQVDKSSPSSKSLKTMPPHGLLGALGFKNTDLDSFSSFLKDLTQVDASPQKPQQNAPKAQDQNSKSNEDDVLSGQPVLPDVIRKDPVPVQVQLPPQKPIDKKVATTSDNNSAGSKDQSAAPTTSSTTSDSAKSNSAKDDDSKSSSAPSTDAAPAAQSTSQDTSAAITDPQQVAAATVAAQTIVAQQPQVETETSKQLPKDSNVTDKHSKDEAAQSTAQEPTVDQSAQDPGLEKFVKTAENQGNQPSSQQTDPQAQKLTAPQQQPQTAQEEVAAQQSTEAQNTTPTAVVDAKNQAPTQEDSSGISLRKEAAAVIKQDAVAVDLTAAKSKSTALEAVLDAAQDLVNLAKTAETAAFQTSSNSHIAKATNALGLQLGLDKVKEIGASSGTSPQTQAQPQVRVDQGFANQSQTSARQEATKNAAAKPVPRAQLMQNMEKVETALKEAAKSKDGTMISMRLDPPQLGSVKVDVSIKDGALHARIYADTAQVVQLLRDKASDLQSTLRKMGLDVDKVTVSVSSDQQKSLSDQGSSKSSGGRENQKGQSAVFAEEGQEMPMPEKNSLDHWVA